MKLSEAVRCVERLMNSFPKKSGGFTPENVPAYAEELIDLDYGGLQVVIRTLIRTEDWFPAIAAIRREYAAQAISYPDADQLWREVLRWMRATQFGRQRLAEVPPYVLEMVEFLGGWKELGDNRGGMDTIRAHALRAHAMMHDRAIRRVQCGQLKQLKFSTDLKIGSGIKASPPG